MKRIELTDKRIDCILVLSRGENKIFNCKAKQPMWNCLCDCGTNNARTKQLTIMNKSDKKITTFNSRVEAAKMLGVSVNIIQYVVKRGKNKNFIIVDI